MAIIGIYKITNPKGAIYIGSSIDIERRFKQYHGIKKESRQPKIYNSIKKYSIENHLFEIIQECNISELYKLERYYGELYDSTSKINLNCQLPGYDDVKGLISESTKIKLSESRMGMKHWNKGKKLKEETKNKIRESHLGKKHTIEHRLNVSRNSKFSKLVLDTEYGVYYNSVSELSEYSIYSKSHLLSMLNGNRKNKTKYITI